MLKTDFSLPFTEKLEMLLSTTPYCVAAIDGRCGAGKSTLAKELKKRFDCNVIHMDDFYLPASLRTRERLEQPGGNVHYERFMEEIISPLDQLKRTHNPTITFAYRVFDCHEMKFTKTTPVVAKPLTIIEGVYSMRPEFRFLYDTSLYLDISGELQKERLLSRVGKEAFLSFETRWIPMENRYFSHYHIEECCEFTQFVSQQESPDTGHC